MGVLPPSVDVTVDVEGKAVDVRSRNGDDFYFVGKGNQREALGVLKSVVETYQRGAEKTHHEDFFARFQDCGLGSAD